MRSADFDYELPPEAVAQRPAARRDLCRLAVVDRASGSVRHGRFRDLLKVLRPGDLLVANDSRVMPVRLPCRRLSGGSAEVFLLDPLASPSALPAFLRPAGRVRQGEALRPSRLPSAGTFILRERRADGSFLFRWQGRRWNPGLLERLGLTPLPPYVRRDRLPDRRQRDRDRTWYQTVYASRPGSVAAPTAGLHFTPSLLRALGKMGVGFASVTLHVGAGTFLPVKTERLEDHRIHEELCRVPAATAQAIARCRTSGGRVIAVGTTALRCLESCWMDGNRYRRAWTRTRLYILPGYRFRSVDGLLTNFHQPHSTLLPLVAAFWERQALLDMYADCLRRGYRFLSYGDASIFL